MAGRGDEYVVLDAPPDTPPFQLAPLLEELIAKGVLESTANGYRFCQEPFREALFESLDLPDDVRHKIYRGNAIRLLKLDLDN